MNAIETRNLTKVYNNNFTAVNSLNLEIPKGSIFGMLGPNGAGKTTTIKMLTCLIQPTSGKATVGGYDVQENPDEVRNLLGMVPQQVSLYKDLTVMENSQLCADYYGVPQDERDTRIEDLMELVDIKYAKDKRVGQLSGGQKQKASLVASLVHRPDILFLDEPTIGLDPTTKRTLWDLIRELNDNGHTIILCSHDMHEVDMLCDNVGIINTGNLVAYDTPQGLKDALLESNKQELTDALTKISDESEGSDSARDDLENLSLKKMSVLLKNQDEEIIDTISQSDNVKSVEVARNGRINLRIDSFDDMAVQNVLNDIISSGGIITSIFTEEPSLEDVFIKSTSEVNEDDRA
ncbi:MAG: ATP-binding cassette domain-containing protein [Methanobrevibacter thaueri]|jgi:ABC-2 type transport system ATP-binding protein|uniref:ATP-binding cassette domain-containing protein n=1 Tax=Methanobrevibacter thaueri TaxID=190975 RepID=A0A8T3V884_9EURY|nr:ATP-binding cassette domain-containing protein [Methanobrevibacter thaueri]MBE6501090.1 ATP-binding cassette domain-containing protein [Methanobrevibacter thaueri]